MPLLASVRATVTRASAPIEAVSSHVPSGDTVPVRDTVFFATAPFHQLGQSKHGRPTVSSPDPVTARAEEAEHSLIMF